MTTTVNLKELIDLPEWRPTAPAPSVTSAGSAICGDLRNSEDRDPNLYYLASQTVFYKYNIKNDEWLQLSTVALTNALAAGGDAVFHAGQGPTGTLTTGSTTTSVVLNTALPAAVGVNQLANRGDGRGYKIRIIGKSSGGSGKTEERIIVGNTGGTTPTIYLDSALSFTPASTDGYEILSGKVYILTAGAPGAATFRSYDVATNFYASLSSTNLPTITTDSHMIPLCELHCPYDKKPGEGILTGVGTYNGGLLGCLTATASGSTSITGQASAGDAAILQNEYRNFQIRIVEDTSIPTAVGQRRNITSHTAGASPVYTVPAWTVTPSTDAKYVLEYNNDRMILFTTANGNTYSYLITANTWDVSTTWAVRGANCGAGVCGQFPFGISRDSLGNTRHSYLFSIRGGNVNTIDIFDIAGATTGSWTTDIVYGNKSGTLLFTTGTCGCYGNSTINDGRYYYLNANGTQRNYRFDMVNRVLEPYGFLDFTMSTAVVGRRLANIKYYDGTTVIPFLVLQRSSAAEMFENLIFR